MATRRRKSAKQEEHTHAGVKVERYDVDSEVSLNWNLQSRYYDYSLDEPVEIACTSSPVVIAGYSRSRFKRRIPRRSDWR